MTEIIQCFDCEEAAVHYCFLITVAGSAEISSCVAPGYACRLHIVELGGLAHRAASVKQPFYKRLRPHLYTD